MFTPVGSTVLLHSLVSRPALNGRRGTVVTAMNKRSGRVGVLVEGEDVPIALKPANLIDAAAEAMRWRAEAIAFAAEVRRVEGEQARQEAQRAAEEEGWREFQQASQAELRARGRRTADAQAEAWRLKHLLARGADATEPPASAATARQLAAVQQALREERERLRLRAAEASEMRRLRDQLQAELDESTAKCTMLQRSVRGLNEQVTNLTHFAI